ncbi:MAG TPA: glycosyltransferase family 2 protein [Polyangiaceae bacterium]|nr:glycosyltransferase family 2 protein [Polyangiaceae bacterium]
MYRDQRIVVAIPAYRAESTIAEVVQTLPPFVDTVIVVDDASPDRTFEVASALAEPRLVLIRHERNQGVGGAMRSAYEKALELGCDVVVKMDSDGQMDPTRVSDLLDALLNGGYDYAKGNRFLHREALSSMPRHRLFGSLVLTMLTKMASGYWHIFDPQNGFVACRAVMLRRLDLPGIASDYFFENDMLVHLNVLSARVVDVPLPARYSNEVSSMRISRILISFPGRLFSRYWWRIYERYTLRDFSPIVPFLFSGILLCAWAAIFGGWAWYRSLETGIVATTGTVMLTALPAILGFQLLLHALLLDIYSTPR